MVGLKVLTKEAEHFLSRLENQIVLDPFMGSGTTGIAALKPKCHFIGIELDETKFQIASARLHDYYCYHPHHQQ
jgi:DNA modification methylase